MNDKINLFEQSSLTDIKRGYTYLPNSDEFVCLLCGQTFTNGIIYPADDKLYEAKKYIKIHIAQEHTSPFHFLLNMDKKLTSLTDHQKSILELFYAGHSDNEIAKALDISSTSTIRNHRFNLREKQKQAKIFLAIMELLAEAAPSKDTFIDVPPTAKQVDARFQITAEENEKILSTYFKQGPDGPLATYPLKEKKRVAILLELIKRFDANKKYSEQEVNAILKMFHDDYVLLRRHLIDYGFMDRTRDGSAYWVKV
jgi:hypothetical protein